MEKITIRNGLEVYINHKKILGECAVYLLINTGRFQEKIPETAHVLEHLQGINGHIYGNKGKLNYVNANAITSDKRTAYYFECILPRHISIATNNLTNVLSSLNINILEREKEVIKHELSAYNNPLFRLSQRSLKKLFPNYTKKSANIETHINSLKDITEDVIRDFWNTHYDPANTTLCIIGDIPQNSDKLIKNFEKIQSKGNKTKTPTITKEPKLTNRIEIKEKIRDDDIASIRISYQAPSFPYTTNLKEHISIDMLCKYLSSNFGPIYKKMRDELRLCYSLNVNYGGNFGYSHGLFFETQTKPNLCYKVEKEWSKCLKQIKKEGISKDILESFKNSREIMAIHNSRNFDINNIIMEMDYKITQKDFQKETRKITPDDLKNAVEIFQNKPYVISIALPRKIIKKEKK